jgi:hypothetical protein
MALTLVATAAASNANSYATAAEGDTYHESHYYADMWTDAGTSDKEKALVMATRLLDQWYEWFGSTYSTTQALLWPRSGVPGPNGFTFTANTIPAPLRDATCELARQLMAENRTADSDLSSQGVKSITAGSVALTFSGSAVTKPIPDAVASFLIYLGTKRSSGGGTVDLYRG